MTSESTGSYLLQFKCYLCSHAMNTKLKDYQRRSSDDKANASHKLAANEKIIEMLTKERDDYAQKYKESESFNLTFNKN